MYNLGSYLGGALLGFVLCGLSLVTLLPWLGSDTLAQSSSWFSSNLGHSVWLFGLVIISYCMNLFRLKQLIVKGSDFQQVVQLDQLSDVWIHVFVGVGVVWTAIGMRSALATTLQTPEELTDGARDVLSRLVDGGILLALTTTIVGAVGGYLMRLVKTISLGASLTGFYDRHEHHDVRETLRYLAQIESQLRRLCELTSLDMELTDCDREPPDIGEVKGQGEFVLA